MRGPLDIIGLAMLNRLFSIPARFLKRAGPSPAQERETKRIQAHRDRNWPDADPWPAARAPIYLPPPRNTGGDNRRRA